MTSMQRMQNILKRTIAIWLPLTIAISMGLFVFLSGSLGTQTRRNTLLDTAINITVSPPPANAPISPYPPINSQLLNFVDQSEAQNNTSILQVYGAEVPPVGAYIPRSGNSQFELPQPTLTPSPLPYPTSPPLPLPPLPGSLIPTVSAVDENGQPRVLPYAGDECAPSGNPVDGILTQRYHAYHSGIDIAIPLDTAVLSTHSGTVTFAGWSEVGYGYLVIIQNGQFITYYAHNNSFNVDVGAQIGANSIIAWSGSTGNSSGPHVHYETRINDIPVDPLTFTSRGYTAC
jgi:murein DD-endopeptidase MepM/ murein hydrolase activator NlpD